MKVDIVPPRVSSFIKSLRDIGYTFEIAVADILDNSLTANAKNIEIYSVASPDLVLCVLDDGIGMDNDSLKEAMRLSTKDPDTKRSGKDLGRFGLGLKTASFSQCRLLTVISKTSTSRIFAKQWDIDKVIKSNEWALNSLDDKDLKSMLNEIKDMPLFDKLNSQKSGALVIWQAMDRIENDSLAMHLNNLNEHLSLVFHRFIDGLKGCRRINISLNNAKLAGFNPFHNSDKQEEQSLYFNKKLIKVLPHIMPSFRKTKDDPEVYKKYGTSAGYSGSQGCYLYRANRLITYATWWRIIKNQDSNQLVRVEIDISNNQDNEWGVTVTKSGFGVTPPAGIRKDLRILFKEITRRGRGTQGGRVKNKMETRYWELFRNKEKKKSFVVNKKHPLLEVVRDEISGEAYETLQNYLHSLEAYLPVEDIHREMINSAHDLNQKVNLDKDEVKKLIENLIEQGMGKEEIKRFIGAEGFNEEMFTNA